MEAFSDEERKHLDWCRENNPELRSWFIKSIWTRDALIAVLRQDGTPAQDYARRDERAKIVAWLRAEAEKYVPNALWEAQELLQSVALHIEKGEV